MRCQHKSSAIFLEREENYKLIFKGLNHLRRLAFETVRRVIGTACELMFLFTNFEIMTCLSFCFYDSFLRL